MEERKQEKQQKTTDWIQTDVFLRQKSGYNSVPSDWLREVEEAHQREGCIRVGGSALAIFSSTLMGFIS